MFLVFSPLSHEREKMVHFGLQVTGKRGSSSPPAEHKCHIGVMLNKISSSN